MASPPSLTRRTASAVAALLLAASTWYLLASREGPRGVGDEVARSVPQNTPAPPLRLDPVLRGAPGAEPVPAAGESARTQADPLSWRITFDVVGPDGAPCPWDVVEFRDARGVSREHVRAAGHVTPGVLDVRGEGRLVVWAEGFVPWVSDGLGRPVAGGRHVVARLDPGMALAGEVFEQDGRTPLAAGSVLVNCSAATLPDGSSFGQQGEVEAGRFRITGLVPGAVEVQVRGGRSRAGQPVRVRAEAGEEDLRIVLGPWGWITLLLVDSHTGFAPATEYLQVFQVDEAGDVSVRMTTSTNKPGVDAEPTLLGDFEAAPGERLRFRLEAQGYEPTEVFEVAVPATGGHVEARVELRPAPQRVGRLCLRLRAEGAPLPSHIQVARHDAGGSVGHGYPVEDGVVVLELSPGPQHLVVGDAWAPSDPGPDWVPVVLRLELAPGEEREADVVLRPGGWVFLAVGSDLRPETVRWLRGSDTREARARPHRRGETSGFLLGLLPPGRWTLWFDVPRRGGRTGEVEVRAGEIVHVDPAALTPVGAVPAGRGAR